MSSYPRRSVLECDESSADGSFTTASGRMSVTWREQRLNRGEIILCSTENARAQSQPAGEGGVVWLTRAQVAELFQTSPQPITQLSRSSYGSGQLKLQATCKESLQVRAEVSRQPHWQHKICGLGAVLAVGYRDCSRHGCQFRRRIRTVPRDYLVTGYAMHDARQRNPDQGYFDELIERIRGITIRVWTSRSVSWPPLALARIFNDATQPKPGPSASDRARSLGGDN